MRRSPVDEVCEDVRARARARWIAQQDARRRGYADLIDVMERDVAERDGEVSRDHRSADPAWPLTRAFVVRACSRLRMRLRRLDLMTGGTGYREPGVAR